MPALAALLASTACLTAPVSYGAPPDAGAPRIPWVRSGPVTGYLFYYGAPGPWRTSTERVLISTGGGPPSGYATKILWHVRGGAGSVTIAGTRLDGVGRFTQRFPASGGFFPSIVDVPAEGCWRITVGSGGRSGRFAFAAIAAGR
jgi:hypothetical protein